MRRARPAARDSRRGTADAARGERLLLPEPDRAARRREGAARRAGAPARARSRGAGRQEGRHELRDGPLRVVLEAARTEAAGRRFWSTLPCAAPLLGAALPPRCAPLGGAALGGAPLGRAPLGGRALRGRALRGAPLGRAPLGGRALGGAPLGGAALRSRLLGTAWRHCHTSLGV